MQEHLCIFKWEISFAFLPYGAPSKSKLHVSQKGSFTAQSRKSGRNILGIRKHCQYWCYSIQFTPKQFRLKSHILPLWKLSSYQREIWKMGKGRCVTSQLSYVSCMRSSVVLLSQHWQFLFSFKTDSASLLICFHDQRWQSEANIFTSHAPGALSCKTGVNKTWSHLHSRTALWRLLNRSHTGGFPLP